MALVAKVVLDAREYDRLLNVEKKYNQLIKGQEQTGKGCQCNTSDSLSQSIAINDQQKGLHTPIPAVLPPITDPSAEPAKSVAVSASAITTHPWYYIGKPE